MICTRAQQQHSLLLCWAHFTILYALKAEFKDFLNPKSVSQSGCKQGAGAKQSPLSRRSASLLLLRREGELQRNALRESKGVI